MEKDVYRRLQEQLDQYSVGFPATGSGVEIQILKKMFAPEEAEMYLQMSMMLETPESVASRTGRKPDKTALLLEHMAGKGLLFRYRKRGPVHYAAIPFVVGAYEFQLKNLDRELAQLVERYMEEAFQVATQDSLTPLRTIPVYRSLDVAWKVAPYQDAREIVKSQETIALADCLCRVQQGLLEQACDKPLEVCMIFGSHADFYVENGMARLVGTQDALDVLDKCEEAGLVNQPFNTVNPGGMCNCCGDCCGVLRSFKKHPKPSEIVFNDYLARVNADECDACETCLERCQMEAIVISEAGHAEVNPDRCIGCGLCVTTCPSEAMKLTLKPEGERAKPPRSAQDLVTRQMEKRGTSLIPLALQNKD